MSPELAHMFDLLFRTGVGLVIIVSICLCVFIVKTLYEMATEKPFEYKESALEDFSNAEIIAEYYKRHKQIKEEEKREV